MTLRFRGLVLSALSLVGIAAPAAVTYYPPIDRIVLNEVVAPATDGAEYPFYLPRRGRYVVELLREPPSAAARDERLDMTFRVMRGKREVFSRRIERVLPAAESSITALWFDVPTDVPDRSSLILSLRWQSTNSVPVRIEITRWVEPPLLIPR
jgi:hypothetical protein